MRTFQRGLFGHRNSFLGALVWGLYDWFRSIGAHFRGWSAHVGGRLMFFGGSVHISVGWRAFLGLGSACPAGRRTGCGGSVHILEWWTDNFGGSAHIFGVGRGAGNFLGWSNLGRGRAFLTPSTPSPRTPLPRTSPTSYYDRELVAACRRNESQRAPAVILYTRGTRPKATVVPRPRPAAACPRASPVR